MTPYVALPFDSLKSVPLNFLAYMNLYCVPFHSSLFEIETVSIPSSGFKIRYWKGLVRGMQSADLGYFMNEGICTGLVGIWGANYSMPPISRRLRMRTRGGSCSPRFRCYVYFTLSVRFMQYLFCLDNDREKYSLWNTAPT